MKRLALVVGALIYMQASGQTIGVKTGLALSGYRATYSTADPTYIPPEKRRIKNALYAPELNWW